MPTQFMKIQHRYHRHNHLVLVSRESTIVSAWRRVSAPSLRAPRAAITVLSPPAVPLENVCWSTCLDLMFSMLVKDHLVISGKWAAALSVMIDPVAMFTCIILVLETVQERVTGFFVFMAEKEIANLWNITQIGAFISSQEKFKLAIIFWIVDNTAILLLWSITCYYCTYQQQRADQQGALAPHNDIVLFNPWQKTGCWIY